MQITLDDNLAKQILNLEKVTGFKADAIVNNSIRLFFATFQKVKGKAFEDQIKNALKQETKAQDSLSEPMRLLRRILSE